MAKISDIEKKLKDYEDLLANSEHIDDDAVDKITSELDLVLVDLESTMFDELGNLEEDNNINDEDYE